MKQYLELCKKAIHGTYKKNRTGIDTVGYIGDMCKYDLGDGFPIVTTKKLAFKTCIAEMLGFLRGYDNAADFRKLGCNVWNANANENKQWLENPNREGKDDLGRVYGVQARKWDNYNYDGMDIVFSSIDQLKNVVDDLSRGIDNRREIVTHWNPSELNKMALPPCHLLYQFGIEHDKLHLSMYQRSCDLPLGVPFNITGYAWLLSVIAHITGLEAGILNHFMHDIHIYENQIPMMKEQLRRDPIQLPTLKINPDITTLTDLETWVTPDDFELLNYDHHPAIKYPFAV